VPVDRARHAAARPAGRRGPRRGPAHHSEWNRDRARRSERMTRHRFDLVAMFFGIAFAATAIGFLIDELHGDSLDPLWVIAAGLLTLGAVAIVATVVNAPRPQVASAPAAEPDPSAGDERVDDTVER